MSQESQTLARLPADISQPLLRLRQLIRRYVLSQGLIFALLFVIVCFWCFGWCDYLPIKLGIAESPSWARLSMLLITCLGGLFIAFYFGLRKGFVAWPLASLSLLLERRFQNLEGAVSTSVMAASRSSQANVEPDVLAINEAMQLSSRELAVSRMHGLDVASVLRWRPLQWQLGLLILLLAASLVGTALHPQWVGHWWQRFVMLDDTPWPRQVNLRVDGLELEIPPFTGNPERKRYLRTFENQQATVIRGQASVLKVSADTKAPRIPAYCTALYQTENGNRGRANLRRLIGLQGDWQPFLLEGPPLEAVNEAIQFSVSANDLKLSGFSVSLVDSPVISNLALQVDYPEYLRQTTTRSYLPEKLEYRNGMRLPQGTAIELQCQANVPLSRIEYAVFEAGNLTPSRQETREVQGNAFLLPLGPLTTNLLIEFRVWDATGLCANRIQQYVLTAIMDEVPRVDMSLTGIGTAITPNAILPVSAKLKDDYGIQSSELEIAINESPLQRFAMPAAPEPTSSDSLEVARTLDLKGNATNKGLNVPLNSTLSLTVVATDFAGTNETPHAGRAAQLQLAVVPPDKLLIILERRELAMRARLELIINELTQLRELLSRVNSAMVPSEPSNDSSDAAQAQEATQLGRMRQLRSQQASMQASKSLAELDGLQLEIGQISLELLNNRIDSQDRRERLNNKVRVPIQGLLVDPFPQLIAEIKEMEQSSLEAPVPDQLLQATLTKNDTILLSLKDVLQNMIDIQDFNELIDMVRDLVDQQQNLLDQTKQEQKRQVLDLFK